jgi:hypothetical protein
MSIIGTSFAWDKIYNYYQTWEWITEHLKDLNMKTSCNKILSSNHKKKLQIMR